MLRWLTSNRPVQMFLVALVALAIVGNALAWQTVVNGFEHSSRYGGEANNGNRTGSVEYVSSERRVRAGAEYISFTQSAIDWNKQNGYPAMVFHISPKNEEGGTCSAIRTVSGWNWSNLPSYTITSKGCRDGKGNNEIRFYYSASGLSTSARYYIQSLYKDTAYNGSAASKTTGQMNVDSYSTNYWGVRQVNDFHGKICIGPDSTYRAFLDPTNTKIIC